MSIDVHFLRRILRLIAAESELRLQFLSVAFNARTVKFCFFTFVNGEALGSLVLTYATRAREMSKMTPRYRDRFWREISETCYQWRWLNSILQGVLTTFSFVGCVCARDRIGFTRRRSGGQLMRCRPTRSLFVTRDRNVISGSKAAVIVPRSLLIG